MAKKGEVESGLLFEQEKRSSLWILMEFVITLIGPIKSPLE